MHIHRERRNRGVVIRSTEEGRDGLIGSKLRSWRVTEGERWEQYDNSLMSGKWGNILFGI